MALYYRYELLFLGEPQGVGFIVGLQDIGIPEEIIDMLIQAFDETLPIPDITVFKYDKRKVYAAFYFTEKGREMFLPTIEEIVNRVEKLDNGWEIIEETRGEDNILYEDEWQVVMLKAHES